MRIKTRDNSKQKGRLIQKWKNKNDNTWNRLIITRILHLERDNDDKNHTTSNKGTKNGNQRQSTCQGEQRGGKFFFHSLKGRANSSRIIEDFGMISSTFFLRKAECTPQPKPNPMKRHNNNRSNTIINQQHF